MNTHTTSPKLIVPAALALAAALGLAAAGVRAMRDRAPLRADAPAQSRRSPAASGGESAELRVQSLILRGGQLRDAGRYQESQPLLGEALCVALR